MSRVTLTTTQTDRGLLTKPIFSSITLFAIPMLLGNALQQLYNVADTWIVGKYIGTGALAAVGAVFALMVFLTSVLLGLCMGSGVVFAQSVGEGREEQLTRRVGTAFAGIALISVLITAVSYRGSAAIIRWMNIPAELTKMTESYLKIVLTGIPAVFLFNFFAGYRKALGDSLQPLLVLVLSTASNIALDFFFVLKLDLGIEGAAWATVLSQYLSGVLCAALCLCRDAAVRRAFRKLDIRKEDLKILGRYSFYTCLQQSVMNLGILMVQGIVNSFGTVIMAAFSAGVKIDAFAYMPAQEYGNAFSTFIAQNYGAKKMDRVRKGIRCGLLTTVSYCLAASLILFLLAKPLIGIFVQASETEVIAAGVQYLHIEGLFYVGIGILFLWYGLYRAVGHPEMSLILTIISLGTRVLLARISASTPLGVTGIWWSIPIGWMLADLAGAWYLRKHPVYK
ncbi:MAG: MATE family efflux transporter [Eubacteriales bacterium]|nr:MATE family efflux transporter [Eubacteriales bacterium]